MEALIVGLGSMRKRRIRCLKALRYEDILAYDLREGRRAEVEILYQVKTTGKLDSEILGKTDIIIISRPHHHHDEYIKLAIENKKPAFVEASVILKDLKELDAVASKQKVLIARSCMLRFYPTVRDIKNIVAGGKYGKITNFTYVSEQYLPDWHPWEMVKDFYVGNQETGGCREIIPCELTWLVDVVVSRTGYLVSMARQWMSALISMTPIQSPWLSTTLLALRPWMVVSIAPESQLGTMPSLIRGR